MCDNDIIVLLDNGHGKNTCGKRSLVLCDGRQLMEWEYTRKVVKEIARRLTDEGIKSIIVVPEDKDISLCQRANRVNAVKGKKIMISVHCNASGNGCQWGKATGWEVFSTKRTNNSDILAQCFLDVFHKVIPNQQLRGHKEEDFTILYKSNCPCVLTENFFMDTEKDCRYMLSDEGFNNIVNLHVEAIKRYISKGI